MAIVAASIAEPNDESLTLELANMRGNLSKRVSIFALQSLYLTNMTSSERGKNTESMSGTTNFGGF